MIIDYISDLRYLIPCLHAFVYTALCSLSKYCDPISKLQFGGECNQIFIQCCQPRGPEGRPESRELGLFKLDTNNDMRMLANAEQCLTHCRVSGATFTRWIGTVFAGVATSPSPHPPPSCHPGFYWDQGTKSSCCGLAPAADGDFTLVSCLGPGRGARKPFPVQCPQLSSVHGVQQYQASPCHLPVGASNINHDHDPKNMYFAVQLQNNIYVFEWHYEVGVGLW